MAMDGQMADKLRGFLRELTPRARAMLLAELERGESRGVRMPGSELIMRELRQAEKPVEPASRPPAIQPSPPVQPATLAAAAIPGEPEPVAAPPAEDEQAARMFFAFLEPFFVDDTPEHAHMGRLSRSAATGRRERVRPQCRAAARRQREEQGGPGRERVPGSGRAGGREGALVRQR